MLASLYYPSLRREPRDYYNTIMISKIQIDMNILYYTFKLILITNSSGLITPVHE